MTNSHDIAEAFETGFLRATILSISISSGISGTYNAGRLAAEELRDKYPERRIEVFDSMGAGLGIGLRRHESCRLQGRGGST